MLSYEETLAYLYAQLPMFTRVGPAAYKPDLHNTIQLLEALGNPQQGLRCIHIAGTNGKGSTSNMLAAILQQQGYTTGLYTSPHLVDFRERIRIDGAMIGKQDVIDFTEQHRSLFEAIQPSFFEMTVGLCFDHFRKNPVEIAVIETGLGGRLDSTNVITPVISIITNIGFDHMNLLGDTLPKIASEKAGIIKPGIPVVIGETDAETAPVFQDKAMQCHSLIVFADEQIEIIKREKADDRMWVDVKYLDEMWLPHLEVSLTGDYQIKNLCTVLQSVRLLQDQMVISESAIRKGLACVQQLTGFAGRWQVLQKNPLVITDTGHNAHGLQQTMHQLQQTPHRTLHIVFGVVKDKALEEVLHILPREARYYLCAPDLPRALPVQELQAAFEAHRLQSGSFASVAEAYTSALKEAGKEDVVFIGGSTFVVGELLTHLHK